MAKAIISPLFERGEYRPDNVFGIVGSSSSVSSALSNLPEGLKVDVNYNSWPLPEVFRKIMLAGEILEDDMITTFNMGIGFCIVVPPDIELNEGYNIGTVQKV